ncbi:energy transducer TonB [Noviherbaspirillum saxi]|uniref:TonB family protein n=1 Tax=Noviherbaspirillum saxi TaxID=2320863 RepID=A0A3A3FHP8_9BURK|nr:energy transducer TonB [Noviherbaspirillum saxi]RJF92677.1 TonB family protein [Noviherbaspirillum saxi]
MNRFAAILAVIGSTILVGCATQPPVQKEKSQRPASLAAQSSAARLSNQIRSNIAFDVPKDWLRNDPAEYSVTLFPDGSVRDIQLLSSSGLPGFDSAVLKAIEKSQPYSLSGISSSPPRFILLARPLERDEIRTGTTPTSRNVPNEIYASQVRNGNVAPEYPVGSLTRKESGTVLLRVLVNRGGTVDRLELIKSSGYVELDESARLAVSTWKFTRSKEETVRNATTWVQVPIKFELPETDRPIER